MPYEVVKKSYDEHGFFIVRQFLSPGEFAELSDNLDRYIRDIVPTLPDGDAFYQDRSKPETLEMIAMEAALDFSR